MRLTDIPLDRPIATLMLLLSLTVLGTVAVFMLPLDFMPIINEPEIDMEIPFPGAHPLEALREVVEPIEEEIATIPDVKRILAFTQSGSARMEVIFDWGVDVDIKKMEVREAVDRARPELPETIGHISIRGDTDGGSAQVLAGRISAERNLSESWDLLDRRIGRPLERIKGVARVDLYGVEQQQVRIDLDLDALRRHGIDAGEVLSTVNAANQDVDAGVIRGDVVRYEVRTVTRFQSADEIAALRVGRDGLRVGDVAVVEMREPRLDYGRHLDRSFAVGIDVYKEPSANTIEVVEKALARIEEIRADPQLKGINVLIWENQGEAIRNSLKGLRNAGIYGGLMAVAILHFFLRRFRTTLIVATAIPFSLLVTCGAMYALGSQFNVLTLLGLMLGVGMLVDNAVVVIENIHRYEGMGNPAPLAARLGARQVALAVVASTATSIFVWSWLFVSERDTMIIIFSEVALTICLAVACSLLISLTFIPLAAARFAPAEKPKPGIVVRKIVPAYRRVLNWTLDHRLVTLTCLFVVAGSAAWPIMKIEKSGDIPDQTREVPIFARVHDDVSKEVLEGYVDQVEEWVFSRKEELGFDSVYSWYSEHGFCMTRIYLPETKANPKAIERLREQLREGLPVIAGVSLEVGDRDMWRHRGGQDRRMVSVSL
ncbi:MAG: efflux RND transporter permease subunit, partial [Acidobacteriota bacterium]|nr:efflux RND transporter permease subunit [Acidobacteriota bacterium]